MWIWTPGADLQGWVPSSPGLQLPPCLCFSSSCLWAGVRGVPGSCQITALLLYPFLWGLLFFPDVASLFCSLWVALSGLVAFVLFSCYMWFWEEVSASLLMPPSFPLGWYPLKWTPKSDLSAYPEISFSQKMVNDKGCVFLTLAGENPQLNNFLMLTYIKINQESHLNLHWK